MRAVIEGQFLAKLNHARKLGYEISPTSRVLATGGASANERILQVSGATYLTEKYAFHGTDRRMVINSSRNTFFLFHDKYHGWDN